MGIGEIQRVRELPEIKLPLFGSEDHHCIILPLLPLLPLLP
ncbi:hypothetical protein FDUTEX481_00754 [Tolypothrix sp. PCC 7601]|nr:hypothetical protein FDUTEX481_00754 [Tolypothrix sp. PCC 7601]